MFKQSRKGFTLIELLVVVAIIGLLASIVIASLNSARQKGRDARRVSDVRQIQTAMEMYNDANSQYPSAASTALLGSYISIVPTDPVGTGNYTYKYAGIGASSCSSYHYGATLEVTSSSVLSSAAHVAAAGTVCSGSLADFNADGSRPYCGAASSGTINPCYDVKVQ